ncbi:MAG: S9 family peptidase [Planctomycetota bacterium]|nr:S9 family peptidase [Planctomycetota bacterium]
MNANPTASAVGVTGSDRLSIDALFGDPKTRVDFSGRPKTTYTWIDGERWLERKKDAAKSDSSAKSAEGWLAIDARTGTTAAATDFERAAQALVVAQAGAPNFERMTKDRTAQLVTKSGDVWIVPFDGKAAKQLTQTPDVTEEESSFSPDGKRVAFIAKNDLFVVDVETGVARALTSDGSEMVLNGKLDWLYQEEVYGRGTFKAYWWSPDSTSVAYLRLDETGVPLYTIVDDSDHVAKVETSPYPQPGETNPAVKLGVASVASAATTFVDLGAYAQDEPLVVDVSWSPASELVYCVQDREQTWLDLRIAEKDATRDRLLFRETTPAWVERNDQSPMWLADGSFLWSSERSGFKHIYRYQGAELVSRLTTGEWEVRTLHGVDEKKGLVFFSGTERSAIGSDAYSVGLDGKNLKRLTAEPGTHTVQFSPDFSLFIDAWSDVWTPTKVKVCSADGALVRMLDENKVETVSRYAYSKPELLTVKTRDGFEMNALLVKPTDFDPTRKYPVMMFVYAGPHNQTVRNAWGGTGGMFQQLLAQKGIVSWSCDNRTSSGKGAVSAWPCYQQLGVSELADIDDSIAWLESQGFVDEDKIGISGWSYGGFMTGYALTHSKMFSLGIAGGSVTDWRNYDSIYTERYMRLPKNNAKGYDATSVVKSAENVHGKLILVHGQIDDNVHAQNTLRLAHALQKANADFELMLYPATRHGITNPLQTKHWRTLMLRAMDEAWGLAVEE